MAVLQAVVVYSTAKFVSTILWISMTHPSNHLLFLFSFIENVCKGYLNYRTNYYESFSEFVHINNNLFSNYFNIICCNIRSINAHFDKLICLWKIILNIGTSM